MPNTSDIEDAFAESAEIGGSWLKLGGRPRVRCLVPEGVEIDAEEDAGKARATVTARVTTSAQSFGRPKPMERGTLDHGGTSYELAVASDEVARVTGAGALYEFTLSNA